MAFGDRLGGEEILGGVDDAHALPLGDVRWEGTTALRVGWILRCIPRRRLG
jgi:hypothetical protein